MSDQIWEVTGGSSSGGVVVRKDESTTSEELPERLSHGALVRELALVGTRLKFIRVSGTGPLSGWASTSFRSTNLLERSNKKVPYGDETSTLEEQCANSNLIDTADLPLFCVSGGSGKGGILVRELADTSSEAFIERLSTGAIIRVKEVMGERISYELIDGVGPRTGWVSQSLKGVPLLYTLNVRSLVVSERERTSVGEFAPILDRKLRILAIHGAPANTEFMSFQTAQLRFKLGKDIADWIIPTGLFSWEPSDVKTTPDFQTYTRERTEFEKRLAKGKPFMVWFTLNFAEGGVQVDREKGDQSRDYLKKLIEAEAPIDVVVTFSQAAIMACSVMETFRREGKTVPWRLNVFFGAPGFDMDQPLDTPFSTPTVFAWGEQDPWNAHRHTWNRVFADQTVLEYGDGHEFPTKEPQASQVYGRIVQQIRRHCGLSEN